jgi:hypothetical protein
VGHFVVRPVGSRFVGRRRAAAWPASTIKRLTAFLLAPMRRVTTRIELPSHSRWRMRARAFRSSLFMLTLAGAVSAARLSGAEEFIERMPSGYDTYIEEGSPNLSCGHAQRLAIARA